MTYSTVSFGAGIMCNQFWYWRMTSCGQSGLVLAYDQFWCCHIIVNFRIAYSTVSFGAGV
ncbi:unnamed protein product [Callosobruchus maculatus]|uniref:Uncharacterized protein n=1 Tax=Callosobruchus maculatus TaxID=64391 RepID=A0A653BFJ1_CALMS|nr:unnamed protein product [Callosobruchus maculatus]VEN34290.1 unnamed protein product [Callosobruchus maculatus]